MCGLARIKNLAFKLCVMMTVRMCVCVYAFEVHTPVVGRPENSESSISRELQVCLQCKHKESRITSVLHTSFCILCDHNEADTQLKTPLLKPMAVIPVFSKFSYTV